MPTDATVAPVIVLADVAATPIVLTVPFAVRSPVTVVPVAVLTATLFAPPLIEVLVVPVRVLVAPVTMLADEPAAPMVLDEPAKVPIWLVEACVVPMLLVAPFRFEFPVALNMPVISVPVVVVTSWLPKPLLKVTLVASTVTLRAPAPPLDNMPLALFRFREDAPPVAATVVAAVALPSAVAAVPVVLMLVVPNTVLVVPVMVLAPPLTSTPAAIT